MNLTHQIIEYQSKGAAHRGYLAWDADVKTRRPGIIVIHEWWGLDAHMRGRADQLARQGYCAFAIDMYGDGRVAENLEQAKEASGVVYGDMEMGAARLQAGYDALLQQPQVDAERTAAIGYCFGGAMVLHMARIGLPLRAVASFHGALRSHHQPVVGQVKARVLVCHGGDDAMVSMDDVAAFKQEMDDAGADYEVIVHAGAQHGFTNKQADVNAEKYGIAVGYNAQAQRESWAAMTALFERSF
ncbi:dienelactone hydrolase family protein [Candidatus Spongiihabitans sp.]|uniref:dienelactone hydrolase family protein n=1 Tax=Candidatus Spongiihabitans sp. TaxID=3101308 RepID=UPI003C7A86E2